jgi:hypothetical protein
VRTGDTLDAIAQGYGITRDELALFNWGTTNADEIDQRLRREVGCRRHPMRIPVKLDSCSGVKPITRSGRSRSSASASAPGGS